MILYHGSLNIVKEPKILTSNRTLDYGTGFYTTTSKRQAIDWARRRIRQATDIGYVNIYNFDSDKLSALRVLRFDKPSDKWIDFVEHNRKDLGFNHDYDIVYGPVANDRVYVQLALFEQGFISKQTLIEELKTYKLVDQMLFHTEKALKYLNFMDYIKVEKQ